MGKCAKEHFQQKKKKSFSLRLIIKKIYNYWKQLKIKAKTNVIVLLLGVNATYFKFYMLTVYAVVHFIVVFVAYLSEDFSKKLENFKKDQITIREHYLESFRAFYYFFFTVRILTIVFYLYFSTLSFSQMHSLSNVFYGVSYLFILVNVLDLSITLYIILYMK